MTKFSSFNFDSKLLEALDYMGFKSATPIQEQAIPKIINNKDLLACAQTGTGKTAAFILPIINRIVQEDDHEGVNTLVIVPTRELALQIDQEIQGFSYFISVSSMPIYGGSDGSDFTEQKNALNSGTDIIIATPGKLLSHLAMGFGNFKNLKHLILDEADRMLDMGFNEDIQKIISYLPKKRQNLLFSATMPAKIKQLANAILHEPEEIKISISKPAEGVLQGAYLTYENQKTPLIHSLISDKPEYKSILIFSSTKLKVFDIVRSLKKHNFNARGISSDFDQKEREEVLLQFRSKNLRILVATDVLSRGIDIKDINLVINYDVPSNAEDYIHRIGRTARADTTGVALSMVNEKDMILFHEIEELMERKVIKVPMPSEIGEGPEWKITPQKQFRKGKKKFFKKRKS